MANKIVLKKSSVAAKVPLSADLEVGEIAVNLADQKLYSKKTDGTVILVGSAAGGVDSVNGQTGVVVLDAADVGAVGTITSSDGSINVVTTGSTVDIAVSEASPASTLLGSVRNQTGATLTKGTVVYISGATGNKALVSKAIATSDATSAQTYGVITTDLANNANGYVTIVGALTNLNTSAFSEGVQLYLSSTTAGAYTATKQYAPAHLVYVGVVTRSHPTQGSIEVKIQNGYEMDELHNVSAQTPSNGNVLIWNNSTQLWESAGITAGTGISVTNGAGSITVTNTGVTSVGGTGTVNGITLSGTVTTTGNLTLGGTLSGISLTTQVSGTLPIANGGTNATTAAAALTNLGAYPATNPNGYITSSGSITGNAATATALQTARTINGVSFNGTANITVADSTKLPLAGGNMTGLLATVGNTAGFTGANDTTLSVRSSGPSTAASMSFHRPGAYAVNLGLDTDNVFKLGGWSAGGVQNYWDFSGNAYATGSMRSPVFYDLDNTGYYANPASTSVFNQINITKFQFLTNNWSTSSDGFNRLQFENGASTYMRGVSGSWYIQLGSTSTTTTIVEGAGNFYTTGAVTAYWSDKRLKKNIVKIEDWREILGKINGYRFEWNDLGLKILGDSGEQERGVKVGVIAQEAKEALPQSAVVQLMQYENKVNGELIPKKDINYDPENPYLTVQLEKYIPVLIEATKGLMFENEDLKDTIQSLMGRIATLENKGN